MKKRSMLFIVAAIVVAFSSCKKDDENLPFNELGPEENKAIVENSAINAAKTFDAMKDHNVIDAMVSLGSNLDASDPMSSKTDKKSKFTKTVKAVGGLGTGETGINELFSALADPGELSDDPESVQEVWDEVVGTYTWNSGTESWDYEANAEEIVFLFPSTTDGTTNNATLTIYDYAGVEIASPIDEEYDGDLPVSLHLKLEIDESEVLTYLFAVEYNDDGIPSSITSELTMEPYMFTIDITNNDEEISATYQFTDDGDIVLKLHGSLKGDFTEENNEWGDDVEVDEVIHSGNMKVQLYNISVGGIGDVAAIAEGIEEIYPEGYRRDQDFDEEVAAQLEAELLNEHLQLFAIDEDDRKKIADVEAYVVDDSDDWGPDFYVDFRLVFSDGSLVDMETYFEEGFEDFVDELNDIISDLNNKYDLELEEIEY